MVDAQSAPNMAALGERGVSFPNGHSVMPTFTMANASALATGHYLGDTGVFSNTIYVAFPVPAAAGNVTPFLENDAVLGALDEHFAGDYLNETTLLKAARDMGFSTAAVGKRGPARPDPHGTHHHQVRRVNHLTPAINGPTPLAPIKNADDVLGKIEAALTELGMASSTNIVVTADHRVSTISTESETSPAARVSYKDVLTNHLPPGFLALDIAQALGLPVFDPDDNNSRILPGSHSARGNGLIGENPVRPDVVVAANGGSDLIYLPSMDRNLARQIVRILLEQDYVSGVFVDDALDKVPGTLPLSSINLKGRSVTPTPAIVVKFRTFDSGCGKPTNCGVVVADTLYQQGQGQHGSFGRADTFNFMAAAGPDFKRGFLDPAPVSNADLGPTTSEILGLRIKPRGRLLGRVIREAVPGGTTPRFSSRTVISEVGPNRLATTLNYQIVGNTKYFDAAGFSGRTLGLDRKSTRLNSSH